MNAEEIIKEHPTKLLMAAYLACEHNSAEARICAAAVDMVLKLPRRPQIANNRLANIARRAGG